MQNINELTQEQKQKIVDEINKSKEQENSSIKTEVTSIKEQEIKTGKTIEVPTADKLVAMAGASLIKRRQDANQLMAKMSKKQVMRAVLAFLDLPTDGVPVFLKEENEKRLFAVGQRAIQDRFIIIQHHINQQIALQRANEQQTQENTNEKQKSEQQP